MPRALHRLFRAFAVLAFVAFALTRTEAVAAEPEDEIDVAALGEGSCGDWDPGEETMVFCGQEFLPHLAGVEAVRMSANECSALLELLFEESVCDDDERCGDVLPGVPPAPGPKLASGASSAGVLARDDQDSLGGAGRVGPSADDRLPTPLDLSPDPPPPRTSL